VSLNEFAALADVLHIRGEGLLEEDHAMTETAVLEEQAPPRLIRASEEAVTLLQTQLEKGNQLRSMKIRSGQDLDQARAAKLDWTTRTTEVLNELFDSPAVAEQCNDWVGRIYPEYAEFGNFVEQFYAEMDHRIKRIKGVLKQIDKLPSPVRPLVDGAAAPAVAVPGVPAAPMPASIPVPLPPSSMLSGLLVVRKADEAARQSVAEFLESLDIEMSIVEETSDMANMLDRNRDISFAVVLSGEAQNQAIFELGFCAGRLGVNRVILMHLAGSAPASDAHGLTHINYDSGGGWQLLVARHLRRSGLNIDLNRLC
jgi:hypothetical protein